MFPRTLAALFLAPLLLACALTGVPAAPIDEVATSVAATIQAAAPDPAVLPTSTTAAPPETAPDTGSISGSLGYPSSFIPELVIVAFNSTGEWYYTATVAGATEYQIYGLPPGVYTVVAYVPGDTRDWGGGYTAAVLCGLSVDCTDHGLIPITVAAGQLASGIDLKDWYAEPGTFPDNPVP